MSPAELARALEEGTDEVSDDDVEYADHRAGALIAYRSLARSRDVPVESVLVAAAGDVLDEVVAMPEVRHR